MNIVICLLDDGFLYTQNGCASINEFIRYEDQDRVSDFFKMIQPGAVVDIVIDVAEEELDLITAPKVYPWEKSRLLKINERKINKKKVLFYSSSIFNDNESTYIRIVEIYRNKNIEEFINLCIQYRYIIKGIYLSDLIVQDYLKKQYLDKNIKGFVKSDFSLLVIRRSHNSYKQLFIKKGRLHMVRTIDIPESMESIVDIYEYIVRECNLTIKYLYNSNHVKVNSVIDILFIDDNKVKSHESEIVTFANSSLVSNFNWEGREHFVKLLCFEDLFDHRKGRIVVNDLPTLSLCLISNALFPSPHVYTDVVRFVRAVFGIKIAAIIFTITILLLGGVYLSYLFSQYLFTTDASRFLSSQNHQLVKLKKDLEKKISIPYDARELKMLVDFSNNFQSVRDKSDVRYLILDIASVLKRFPNVKLAKIDIERTSDSKQVVSPVFNVTAQFVLTDLDVLYQKNLDRINDFFLYFGSKKGVSHLKLTRLPLELNSDKSQSLNERMLMPISLPFELQFRWDRRDN